MPTETEAIRTTLIKLPTKNSENKLKTMKNPNTVIWESVHRVATRKGLLSLTKNILSKYVNTKAFNLRYSYTNFLLYEVDLLTITVHFKNISFIKKNCKD